MYKLVAFRVLSGKTFDASVPKGVALGDLQQILCSAFGVFFPVMQANLVVEDIVYDDFTDLPFAHCDVLCECKEPSLVSQAMCVCTEKLSALVVFERNTTNPYFFDLAQRRASSCTRRADIS